MERPDRDRMETDRRTFVSTFGKAAIVAPPVVTALLSTSLSSPAIAASTGGTSTGGTTTASTLKTPMNNLPSGKTHLKPKHGNNLNLKPPRH
jgi:hypothetical protein